MNLPPKEKRKEIDLTAGRILLMEAIGPWLVPSFRQVPPVILYSNRMGGSESVEAWVHGFETVC
jgi:hypothetical protein